MMYPTPVRLFIALDIELYLKSHWYSKWGENVCKARRKLFFEFSLNNKRIRNHGNVTTDML